MSPKHQYYIFLKKFKKYFIPDNYKALIIKIQKTKMIRELEQLKVTPTKFGIIWNPRFNYNTSSDYSKENDYSIFGIKIELEDSINWNMDRFSNFIYPKTRFDKIYALQWFDKGIDLVFPWEQSRFYFGINLAQKYLISGDKKYFDIFKFQVEDWLINNPYLKGVNWLSTMDVSIRAVNWIIALNLFSDFKNDSLFDKITVSLIQHAEYINSFPYLGEKKLTTNHTVSAYTGLLFLAFTLKNHPKSENWSVAAQKGLENCINDQVYVDGVDFEGSIPYHRLVLELFAYSAIIAGLNDVQFSDYFYQKLFKMFEFCAAYVDKNGNAPQIGDNDSGRLLVFNDFNNNPYIHEHDHNYLLTLGEKIYNFKFSSQCIERDNRIHTFLPNFNKINLEEKKIDPRDNSQLISFDYGGAYFLKNEIYHLCYCNFPTGQNGKGGHNHLDTGSFTLSLDGTPIIVDPGSFGYSRDRSERDKFRSYCYHNTIYNSNDLGIDLSENDYWSLKSYYKGDILKHENSVLEAEINFCSDKNVRSRKFELFENKLSINNSLVGFFSSRLNLHPSVEVNFIEQNQILINARYKIILNSQSSKMKLEDYFYSPFYGKKEEAKYIIMEGKDNINFNIEKVTA